MRYLKNEGKYLKNKGKAVFVASPQAGSAGCPRMVVTKETKFRDDYYGRLKTGKSIIAVLF